MNVGSLFSGIGGLDLGLHYAGLELAWACESDKPCRSVIARHWPQVPVAADVREIDAGFPAVDVLAGGFPCQDVSHAGERAGLALGTRSGLWFEFARAVRLLRPPVVVVENVPGLLTAGFAVVMADLAEAGYDARWCCFRASDLGAPHGRERIFVLATDASRGGAGIQEPDAADARRRDAAARQPALVRRGDGPPDAEGTGPGDGAAADASRPRRPEAAGRPPTSEGGVAGGRGDHLADGDVPPVRPDGRVVEQAAADADGRRREQRDQGVGRVPLAGAGDARDGRSDAAQDSSREPVQSGLGWRTASPDPSRAGTEEQDGDGSSRPAEHGQAIEAAADAAGARLEGPQDAGAGGGGAGQGRRRQEPERDGGARTGAAAAADPAGSGRAGRPDGEGSNGAGWLQAVWSEGDIAAAHRRRDAGDAVGEPVLWGVYEPAIRRWEQLFGRAAPRPTDDRGRLEPRFVEWMLGFPDGWTNGVSRTQRLKALGNAVQVQAGELVGLAALALLEEECPMCGWVRGTNPASCGECAR